MQMYLRFKSTEHPLRDGAKRCLGQNLSIRSSSFSALLRPVIISQQIHTIDRCKMGFSEVLAALQKMKKKRNNSQS